MVIWLKEYGYLVYLQSQVAVWIHTVCITQMVIGHNRLVDISKTKIQCTPGPSKTDTDQADEVLDQQYEELKKQDGVGEKWTDNLKKAGGDKIEAAAKTFVSKDMQDK